MEIRPHKLFVAVIAVVTAAILFFTLFTLPASNSSNVYVIQVILLELPLNIPSSEQARANQLKMMFLGVLPRRSLASMGHSWR
jgi:hypothetical protein